MKVKTGSGLETRDEPRGSRGHRAETEVIPLAPYQEIADVQQIGEDAWHTEEFVTGKTEEHVTCLDGGSQGGSLEQQRLDPGDSTLSKWAREKQVLETLHVEATKTSGGKVVTKGGQAFGRVQHTVGDLPIKIDHFPVQRKERERLPNQGPIQVPISRAKLSHTMGLARIKA
ncbi:hypothetical protein OS493_019558 [Desmophyllum pertusum]|uniref:Uncharacterized protein n=1 Tax=Desmophyllum pertusum TaxID=174260 RepID=A0A9W9ZQC0_9CNID|nr:hypothetical protein OS493_019558 [Desmophyllum pertusum]